VKECLALLHHRIFLHYYENEILPGIFDAASEIINPF
jgi:hypothetical protein